MPAIAANGWTLPIAVGGASRGTTEAGGRALALDATERRSSIGDTRPLSSTSKPLSPADAAALRGWVLGYGDRWVLGSDVLSGAGETLISGSNYNYVARGGRYATGMVSAEDAATNILTSGQQDFSSGWAGVSGATVTRTTGQPITGVTANGAYRIQTTGGTATRKYSLVTSIGTLGVYSSWVCKVQNNSASAITCSTVGLTGAVAYTVPGSSYRVIRCTGTGTGSTTRRLDFNTAAVGTDLDVTVFQPMFSDTSFGASHAATSRAAGTLELPTTCTANEGTISVWWEPWQATASIVDQATSPAVWTLGAYNTNNSIRLWAFAAGATPSLALYVKGATASGWSLVQVVPCPSTWYQVGVGVHLIVSWVGTSFTVYVQGTSYGTFTATDGFTFTSANITFGTGGASSANGAFHELITAPYSINAGQAAALHARTASIPALPELACDGDLLRGLTVNMTGSVGESADIVAVSPSVGSYRESVPFTLTPA